LATFAVPTRHERRQFFDRTFDAFLFDMDGTILNSIASAERVWSAWAERHGLDVASFLPTIHGVRAIETITALRLPGVDAKAEVHALLLAEIEDVEGIEAIEGAKAFLASLRLTDGPSSRRRPASLPCVVLKPPA
jgi:mannitol-1-/sugar-/sorbitol-6-phosphatase